MIQAIEIVIAIVVIGIVGRYVTYVTGLVGMVLPTSITIFLLLAISIVIIKFVIGRNN